MSLQMLCTGACQPWPCKSGTSMCPARLQPIIELGGSGVFALQVRPETCCRRRLSCRSRQASRALQSALLQSRCLQRQWRTHHRMWGRTGSSGTHTGRMGGVTAHQACSRICHHSKRMVLMAMRLCEVFNTSLLYNMVEGQPCMVVLSQHVAHVGSILSQILCNGCSCAA